MTRLTLRTILAYLDDALSPEEAKDIGDKIAANPAAQQLMNRMQKVTRRRRLTAPEFSGGDDSLNDPNLVAAYLDGQLEGEELAALEKLCLESDLHLAELAACHQLQAVGRHDPITIPPLAQQRMYAIAKGPESIPHRLPPVELTPLTAREDRASLAAEEARAKHRPWRWYMPLSACVLVGGIIGLIIVGTQGQPVPSWALRDQAAATRSVEEQTKQPLAPDPLAPQVLKEMLAFAGRPESLLAGFAGYAAARPTLPPNFFLAMGQEEPSLPVKDAPKAEPEAKAGDIPPPVPDQPPPVIPPDKKEKEPPAKPEYVKIAAGQYEAESHKDGLLFREIDGQGWQLLKPQAFILTHEPILALPAARGDFQLSNKMKLSLLGSLPGSMSVNYFFESALTIRHQNEVDLDLEMERGRCLITRRPDAPSTVRVRFLGDVWDVKLLAPETEIGIEVTGRVLPHAEDWLPHRRLAIYVVKGVADVERGEHKETLSARKVLLWDSVYGGPGPGVVRDDSPAWLTRRVNYPNEVREALNQFQKRLLDKLNSANDISWVKIACDEALMSRRAWEHYLALFTLGAFDQISSLVAALDEGANPYFRLAALDALLHFLGRKPDQVAVVRDAFKKRGYPELDAAIMLDLLRGVHAPDKAKIETLVLHLKHDRLAIRELAFRNLTTVVPPNLLTNYDPAAPVEQRDQAAEAIRDRLFK